MSEIDQTEPVPFGAVYGATWGDADPRSGGPCPVNITLSVGELLTLRDFHFALLREADRRHVKGDIGEWEYHEIRARHFDMLVKRVAPDLATWTGNSRNPWEAGR